MDIFKGFHEEFGWFIWGLLGIGIAWFVMGGANNPSAQDRYIRPPAPLDSGETYGSGRSGNDASSGKTTLNLPQGPADLVKSAEEKIRDLFNGTNASSESQKIAETTLLSKTVFLDGVAGAQASEPQEEYLRIVATPQADKSVSLEGMILRGSALGTKTPIPLAPNLPLLGTPNLKTAVSLPPTGRAIITSGRSPIGTSFRVNICSGYLDQFQSYTPTLRQECPEPLDELKAVGPANETSCQAFVKTLPRCRAFNGTFPATVSASCKAFVTNNLNHNSCVQRNEKAEVFYKNEWRLFLDKTTELWKNRQEIIKLFDAKGNTVDAITY